MKKIIAICEECYEEMIVENENQKCKYCGGKIKISQTINKEVDYEDKKNIEKKKIINIDFEKSYDRWSKKIMPSVGYAMFSRTSINGIDRGSDFGNNFYVFYETDKTIRIEELYDIIAETWDKYKNSQKYDEAKFCYLNDLDGYDVALTYNPADIVTSADGWDNLDMVGWLWDYVLCNMDIDAIITNDGALVFNGDVIIDTELTKDDWDDLVDAYDRWRR